MSAGGHLNALVRSIQDLHDTVLSFHEAFGGTRSSVRLYVGGIRHRYNLLDWSYTIISGSLNIAYVSVAGVKTVISGAGNSGAGTYSGQTDMSSLGLVEGDFYTVFVDTADAVYDVWLIREARATSYPTLAAFSDEVVYTAPQWQALSDYVEELATETTYPYAPLVRAPTNTSGNQFIGTMHHQCRYLHFEMRWGGAISVKVNGNEVGPFTGETGIDPGTLGNIWPDIDMDGIASPVDYGDDYTIEVNTSISGMLYTLYEWPGDVDDVAGWVALPQWAHGDYVYGSTTAKKIEPILTDLGLLGATAKYQNYPCGSAWVSHDWRFQMRRHYRYLHYWHDSNSTGGVLHDPDQPKIAYLIGASYHEQTLPPPVVGASPWMTFDLESVDKLWISTYYLIAGCSYAIEDVEP